MFSKSVINSARFLRMPPTSRLLYYDLGMAADDDGIVEAFTVIRTTGAAEDDLRVLASRGFITVLNDDLVTYIKDWGRNNYIQKDRYHPSIYQELLVKIADGSGTDTECIQDVSILDTEVRLGKSKGRLELGKESKGADKPPTPARRKYGTYPSNLSYTRIFDRLLELCPIRLCVSGPSRRKGLADDRRELARELLL